MRGGSEASNLLRLALNHQTAKLRTFSARSPRRLRLALNHQTAKLGGGLAVRSLQLRLALNHQTAKLGRRVHMLRKCCGWPSITRPLSSALDCLVTVRRLRLALNHQTAKLELDTSPWKQGLFSCYHECTLAPAWLRIAQVDRDF